MKIGFIGTGVMGTGMVKNLLAADFKVTVYNRTKAHAKTAIEAGATWANSVAALTSQSDVILSIVGFPADVEQIYLGEAGIIANLRPDQIIVDMTTSTPSLAQTIAEAAHQKGALALDAPVSGGDVGAQTGKLTIMAGGDREAFDQLQSVFGAMGHAINYFGEAGLGQHAKMANQIMIAGTMTGMTEMLVYAKAAGLGLTQTIATLSGGSAANWSMANYGPRVIAGDYTPGFFIKHFVKDLRIALEEAEKMHLDLPATKQAKALYQSLVDAGAGNLGTQGLITNYPSW